MDALVNHHDFFISLAEYSSLALMLGLLFSYVLHRHAARAFGILWLAMMASLLLPCGSMLVKHFEWGFWEESTPAPMSTRVTPLENIAIESDPIVEEEILDFSNDLEPYEGLSLVHQVSLEAHAPFPWKSTLLIGWGCLSLALILRLVIRWQHIRLLLNQCTDQHHHLTEQLERDLPSSLQINRNLRILSHPQIRTPAIWCWGRNLTLLIPEQVQPNTDWVSVFCHELAHAQRRDHLSGLLAEIQVCLLPWQPLMWWAKHRLALLSEQACDDWVLASGRKGTDYAESLLNLLPQRQVAFVPTMASSRKGVAGRIERILKDQCGNPRLGILWTVGATLIAIIIGTGIALAQTRPATEKENTQPIQASNIITESDENTSVAWHIMRQNNDLPLLHGMPQRLLLTIEEHPDRQDPIWQGSGNDKLTVNVTVDQNRVGEILLGLFTTADWTEDPVQLRSCPQAGETTFENLPTGEFYIGAIIGSTNGIHSGGCHSTWPQPITITHSSITQADVLLAYDVLSPWFSLDFEALSQQTRQDTDFDSNPIRGRITDASGQPVPFAEITYNSEDHRTHPWTKTYSNKNGIYQIDKVSAPFKVNAYRTEVLPDLYGYRDQYLHHYQTSDPSENIDLQFNDFPTGTAQLRGQVVDINETPLQEFTIRIIPDQESVFSYEIPFITTDGRFELNNLPPGRYALSVFPLNFTSGRYRLVGQSVTLSNHQPIEVHLTWSEYGLILWGCVQFNESYPTEGLRVLSPRIPFTTRTLKSRVDQEGFFHINLKEWEAYNIYDQNDFELCISIPYDDGLLYPIGQIPFDALHKDQAQVKPVILASPPADAPHIGESQKDRRHRLRLASAREHGEVLIIQQAHESDEEFKLRRIWLAALDNAGIPIKIQSGETEESFRARRLKEVSQWQKRHDLNQEPNESDIDFHDRIVKCLKNEQTEINTEDPSNTESIQQNPGESDAAFRARRARELAKQRAKESHRESSPLATDPQAPQLKATTESLLQHDDESQAAYQQRLFESAVKAAQIYIPYQSQETTYEYHIRRKMELDKLRSQLALTPPDHVDLAIFHERLVEQIQDLIPTQSEYTSEEIEIKQNPGESDAAFRARRARELARRRARNRDGINPPLATDPEAPRLKANPESLLQRSDESPAAYQQRLFESAVQAAQIYIPYRPHEMNSEYHARRIDELEQLRNKLTLTPPANEDLSLFYEHLVEQIQDLFPTQSEYTSVEIRQHPGESDASFRARRARELAKRRAAGRDGINLPLATDPEAPRLKSEPESLLQRSDESQTAYQQRLFESAVKAAQVYIPYQTDETTSEYHARRQRELATLRSQLTLTPTNNANLTLFYERLVEQIQALIPTQSAETSAETEIKQNPGESDAAFRARRARALAKRRAEAHEKTVHSLAQDPQGPKLKASSESLLQYPDESQADYQQRLFESAIRAAQVYIPYQPQESTSEYHARRKKVLSELRDKLTLTPPVNEDLALFHERLVEQIQTLLPTQTANATEDNEN